MKTICASPDLLMILGRLLVIAAYAKASEQMELYNQAKNVHDDLVKRWNSQKDQYVPKKKSFWTPFSEEEATFFNPLEYLEDNYLLQVVITQAKEMDKFKLDQELEKNVDWCNWKMGKKIFNLPCRYF